MARPHLPDQQGAHVSGATPTNGNGNGAAAGRGIAGRLQRFTLPRFRFGNGRHTGTGAAGGAGEYDLARDVEGLQAVIRGADDSFGTSASAVEARALELARAAAAANLPRTDVAYTEVAEEAELTAQSRSVFHAWVESVRTRVQDALQHSTQQAGAELRRYENQIGALETALAELPVRRQELREAQVEAEAGQSHLEFRAFISRVHYIVLVGLLVIVDWIANVPVFSELLPKDPGADEAWRELAARSETMGLWGGLYRIYARAAHNIDATLLAFGIIIALVWLAHAFGESLRRLVTHSSAEHPTAALTIKGQRRQAWFPTVLPFAGIVLLLGVLWTARAGLPATTQNRVAETEAQIEAVQGRLGEAEASNDLQAIGDLEKQLEGLATQRAQRIERADYARVIGDLNWPIFLLNLVLAVTAAVAAYLRTSGRVNGVIVSPRVAELKQRVAGLMLDAGMRRSEMASADVAIRRHFGRVEYLLRSRPLSGWRARAQRLEGVVPSFRSENARLRGIDSANIAAFRNPCSLDLAIDEDDAFITSAAALDEYRSLHESLRARASSVLGRIDTALDVPQGAGKDA